MPLKFFDGTGDVSEWEYQIKAKLTAKGYRPQLLDSNLPDEEDENYKNG